MAVERTDKILGGTAAERSAGVDVADKDPLSAHLQEVRTLPYAPMITVSFTEAALVFPVLQVLGTVDVHLLPGSKDENPLLRLFVPEDIGVAEIGYITCNDRIVNILPESPPVVRAVSDTLCLCSPGRCIESDDSILTESCCILLVHHAASTEDSPKSIWPDSLSLMLPVYEVGRSTVRPRHVLPL